MEICEKSTHTDIEFSADGSWHPFVRDTGFSKCYIVCSHLLLSSTLRLSTSFHLFVPAELNISDYGTPSKSDVVTIGDSSPRPGMGSSVYVRGVSYCLTSSGGSVVIDLTVDSDEEVLEPQHMTQRTRLG